MHPAILLISVVLFAVLGFGIGFIINMILKTTWLPLLVTLGLVAYILFDLFGAGKIPGVADVVILIFGLLGTVASGVTIRMLRQKGYRMF
nr:YuiB family protein [Brevibacillus dissolubilis]